MEPQLDVFQKLAPGARFSLESPEDPADRAQRHRMELVLTIAGIVFVSSVLAAAIYMALHATDAEVRKGGVALMTAVLTGVLGFMVGRGSR